MVAMNRPTPTRPRMMGAGVRLKNITRKQAKKPTPSSSSSLFRDTLPVTAAPIIRPMKITSHKRLFISWDQLASRMPMSWK